MSRRGFTAEDIRTISPAVRLSCERPAEDRLLSASFKPELAREKRGTHRALLMSSLTRPHDAGNRLLSTQRARFARLSDAQSQQKSKPLNAPREIFALVAA